LTGVLGAAGLAIRSDQDDVRAQIDLIGVPWLMLGFESLAVQNGSARASGVGQCRGTREEFLH
jgi:hypothetical protein